MPDVTVLMPVYNGARFLRPAIDSILGQTYRDFEFVIVDDGSSDETPHILASYSDPRIRIVRHETNRGITAALNHGLELAAGALVARQDADDLSAAQRLAKQVDYLRRRRDVAIVGSLGHVIDERGHSLGTLDRCQEDLTLRWYQLWDNPFAHSSVMFRRDVVWDELHGYEREFGGYMEDHALWSRVLQRGRGANLPDRLFSYRVHQASAIERITRSEHADARRAAFHQALARVIARNLTAVFGEAIGGAEDADLMACFVTGLDPARVGPFFSTFERLLARFNALNQAVPSSADFQRTIAGQYDAVAYRLQPYRRRKVLGVYAGALRRHPALVRWLPWRRALALAAFGTRGRSRLGRLRHWRPSRTSVAMHP